MSGDAAGEKLLSFLVAFPFHSGLRERCRFVFVFLHHVFRHIFS
jgi:hypothetical protein